MLNAIAIAALIALPRPSEKAPVPQQRPKPATEAVLIVGDPILIPHLPTSASQARKEQRPLLKSLANLRRSVEEDIVKLYKDCPSEKIPRIIALPTEKYELAETTFFLSVLCDTTVSSLLDETLNKWNAWQMALFNYGLISFNNRQAIEIGKTIKPYELDLLTEKKIELSRQHARASRQASMLSIESRQTQSFFGQSDSQRKAVERDVISEAILPDFSKTWELFREHLNGRLQKYAELSNIKNVSQDGDIKHLHETATIILFEQIRLALWICNNVWSRVANSAMPNSLKDLEAYSIQTQIDNNQNNGAVIVRQTLVQQNHVILF